MRMMPVVCSFKIRWPTPKEKAAMRQEQLSKTKEQRKTERRQQKQEARKDARECKKLEQQAWKEWETADDFRRLASKLGVGGLFAAISTTGVFGQYVVAGDDLNDWRLSKRRKPRLARIVVRNIPIIMIDVSESIFLGRGVRSVIAHEIGHHIDRFANGKFDFRTATKRIHAAFEKAGLWRNGSDGDAYSEHIAETLGAYLRGHELNAVLLAEVGKILGKLPHSKAKLINEFRRAQIRRVEIAA